MGLQEKKFHRDKKMGLRRVHKSIINSIAGLRTSYLEEQSLLLHTVMSIIILFLGIYFKISRYDWLFSIILMSLVLCAELLNTAIEANVDLATKKIHPLAKEAKDVGSASTFMMSIIALVGELIIFYPYILDLFK